MAEDQPSTSNEQYEQEEEVPVGSVESRTFHVHLQLCSLKLPPCIYMVNIVIVQLF